MTGGKKRSITEEREKELPKNDSAVFFLLSFLFVKHLLYLVLSRRSMKKRQNEMQQRLPGMNQTKVVGNIWKVC